MKIEEFLSRLDKVERSGSGWIACCPAHGDDNPSMSVSAGDDGRILVHCHAGCPAEAIVQAMGLQMRDLMPENGDGGRSRGKMRKKPAPKPEVLPSFAEKKPRDYGSFVAAYEYQDASGAVIYRVERRVREDGKKLFIQQRPDPDSKYGWAYGVSSAGIERVPFHLPRLLAAAKAGKSVLIVEGEKDVLTAEETLGCAVTCNSGGAGKWEESFARHFAGAKGVVIVADNDPEFKADPKTGELKPHWKGQRHAVDVERKLRAGGFEGTIKKMVMPSVGVTACKDFTDWVEARRAAGLEVGKSAFREALEAAGDWPKAWEFGEADLTDLERAQKSARNTALSPADPAEDAPGADGKGCGRFGRPAPRAPDNERRYEVDFDIGGGRFAKLELQYDWTVEQIFAYSVATISRKCPNIEIPRGVPVRIKAWSAALWLLMRGSFFWHNDYRDFATCMFLDRDSGSCKLMRVMSDEFYAFVAHHAKLEDVDPRKGDLAKVLGLVKQIALDPEYAQGVTPSNSWDRRGNVVYISSGDTQMCRVKDGKVEMVQNGTDGVVFLRGKTLAPWKLVPGGGLDPFASAKLFTGASFADSYGLMNARLWTMNLFACHQTKPPLLVTGGAGSGKTRMAKGIKEILGIRQDGSLDLSVQQIEDGERGEDSFWSAVNDGKLEVYDNFDTKVSWASDALQTAATDGQTKRRKLYTDDTVSIRRANAHLILTSNNPIFSTDGNGGLADRIITIPLVRNRSVSMDRKLSDEIAENRNRYLTWIADIVSKVMADDKPVEESVNERHPDYGEFSVKIGRAIGDVVGVVKALGAAEADKSLLPLKNDVITREILGVLQERNWIWSGTAKEMSDAILARMGDDADEKTKTIYSSRRVAKALNKYLRQFSVIFKTKEPHLIAGFTHYDFNGFTLAGDVVGGLVDLNGNFAKTIERESAHGFTENNPVKSTNPPICARAPSSVPLKEEEGNRESKESEAETGGGDEWEFDL